MAIRLECIRRACLLCCVASCLVLAACGGGGSSASGETAVTTSNGSVADGDDFTSTSPAGSGTTPTAGTGTPASGGVASGSQALVVVAWNDLGMHCVDGKDYSVFSILPPYNNLHAQLINRNGGGLVTSGVSLTYEATPDTTGSINTVSSTKTNFWSWVKALFGVALQPDTGLDLSNPSLHNPVPSSVPAALQYNASQAWWVAEGIPLLPYPDNYASTGQKNFYPMVKVVARDASGNTLASTRVVLPVSDEMSCASCHASGTDAAARPAAGWVGDANAERDWKRNILRLHDEKFPNAVATAGQQSRYPAGLLLASTDSGQPVLCASCHQSNALQTPAVAGIEALTTAIHSLHAKVIDPATGASMDASGNRASCYNCHPGATTNCLRGVMANARNPDGSYAIQCQSCHGSMSQVGASARQGWLDEPTCQSCHTTDATGAYQRYTSTFASGAAVRTALDTRFATTPDVPAVGKSLYRYSTGHGGLQCEACHGATHAIYPTSEPNDNVQSNALQGHAGTIAECSTCHASVPLTRDGGPHGMHTVGSAWVSAHQSAARGNLAACAACHGSDYRGRPQSATFTARSFSIEGRSVSFGAAHQVGCYDCHNGPNGGD
ncbi:doubled CXXCH motif (paired_CXXCH_1) [mine drainage metagenome]|uniref:Doubled CXXCH motif (Paired_CXXCH_1) n=1 Tax=mine drainage metagenome TaxID=410659 RepID=A0A1J5QMM2_9ZZZZ